MDSKCDFSFRHYRECMKMIEEATLAGYNIELIHDVDHCTSNISEFVNAEPKNIPSTFFVRIHAVKYNPFAFENIRLFRKIASMSDDRNISLGLHFEPSFYCQEQIKDVVDLQIEMLNIAYNCSIDRVSIHEPARFGMIHESQISNKLTLYGYNSSYYLNKKYISDSGGRWREGCMCKHIGKHSNLIILTHPIWWFQTTSAENY